MEPYKLFSKVKNRDADAVNMLVDKYGGSLYRRLLDRLQDKELADEAFKKTVLSFFDTLDSLEGSDLAEALLFRAADTVCDGMTAAEEHKSEYECDEAEATEIFAEYETLQECVPQPQYEEEAVNKKRSGAAVSLLILLVSVFAMSVIWVLIGQCMSCEFMPAYDLGYSWFDENVYPLFMIK